MDPTTADAIAAIVADLRPLHDDLALPDTCDIQTQVTVKDSRGNVVGEEWQTQATVRCALEVSGISGREYVAGSVEATDLPYIVTFPYDTDVSGANRLMIAGRTFEVEDVRQGEGFEVATTAACREVT